MPKDITGEWHEDIGMVELNTTGITGCGLIQVSRTYQTVKYMCILIHIRLPYSYDKKIFYSSIQ